MRLIALRAILDGLNGILRDIIMANFGGFFEIEGLYRAIGVVGFFAYLFGFAALQFNHIRGQSAAYALINIFAASCVLVSLVTDFNLASMLIQCIWIFIAIAGLWSRGRTRKTSFASTE